MTGEGREAETYGWTPEMGSPTNFAEGKDQIEARAAVAKERDPFPSVPYSLLSSSEIRDYIRITAMLDSFREEHLKSASYEVFIGGQFIYWKGKRKIIKNIDRKVDKFVKLPANSITFVQVDPIFRLPDYIAIRFNLRITHVHRGLLLGTGPLVDPGFRGKLLIPLHNLTSSEYLLDTSKALIWIEFTKTTAHFHAFREQERRLLGDYADSRRFIEFPPSKWYLEPDEYLFKASGGTAIASSIPTALRKAEKDAKSAKETSESLQKWARGIGVVAVLGAILGVMAAVTNSWSVAQSAATAVNAANQSLVDLKTELRGKSEIATERSDEARRAADNAAAAAKALGADVASLRLEVKDAPRQGASLPQIEADVVALKAEVAKLRDAVAESSRNARPAANGRQLGNVRPRRQQ